MLILLSLISLLPSGYNNIQQVRHSSFVDHVYAQYGIEHNLVLAIIAQESRLNVKATNGKDHGLMQINARTIKRFNFDKRRIYEPKYNIEAGVKVLKSVYNKHEHNWWTRYHSSKPKLRKKYEKDVCRFYIGWRYCNERRY